jgi:hypothetical protein
MLAITSPRSGGRSVGKNRSRTQTMEFFLEFIMKNPDIWKSLKNRQFFFLRYYVSPEYYRIQIPSYILRLPHSEPSGRSGGAHVEVYWFLNWSWSVVSLIKKLNSMVWVREWTIPTERPPLVSEVITNIYGWRVLRGQRDGFLWPYSRFSRQEPLLFYQVAPQLYSRGWVDPVSDPLLFFLVVSGIEPGPPYL